MKQVILKILTQTIALALCSIILLQSFELTTRFKKLDLKNTFKSEESTPFFSFLSVESDAQNTVFYWINKNIKICNGISSNSETENEEEKTKELEIDELCCVNYQIQLLLSNRDASVYDLLSTKLPLPFLYYFTPPPKV
jgi:hypothetical protein